MRSQCKLNAIAVSVAMALAGTLPNAVKAAEPAKNAENTVVVPAIDQSTAYYDLGRDKPLSANATAALRKAKKWENGKTTAYIDQDGTLRYTYSSGLHEVVCAPMQICDIVLQPGETLTALHAGDDVRWKISPEMGGQNTQHIIVKPIEAGLETTLVAITDRRAYHLALVSRRNDMMPSVGFDYPEDTARLAQLEIAKQAANARRGKMAGLNVQLDQLDFNYDIAGGAPWKPTRVYNDGQKTFIDMPPSVKTEDMPTLLALTNGKQERMVNYRLQDQRFIVDGVFPRMKLISSVGPYQQEITITRAGLNRRWGFTTLGIDDETHL